LNETRRIGHTPAEAEYESVYDEKITDFSYEELKRLAFWSRIKGPEFFLIGGWAAWHYHRGAGSGDIDIIFSNKTIMECFLPIYYRENGYTEVRGPMGIERRFEKRIPNVGIEIVIDIDATCMSDGQPFKEDRKKNIPYTELSSHFKQWNLGEETVKIPNPELLLLQKIKAHRDRTWEFDNQTIDPVRSEYLKSKIWKDEYDIRHLEHRVKDIGTLWEIADKHKCRDLIEDTLRNLRLSQLIR
jgi:hypothetical protein